MWNRTADTRKNAPITHCMTVHKKRITNFYFIFIPKCQFSIYVGKSARGINLWFSFALF